jgi:peptidoglycan/LPS O-acetylase OafA/YrhL
MAGALLAMLFRSKSFSRTAYIRPAWIGLLIAVPMALLTANRVGWAVYSFTALASACFVLVALCSEQKWLQMVLGNRVLLYTGTISYGIYLLEKIPIDAVQSLHLDRHPVVILPLTALATYLLATISWNVLEKPCLRLKRFFELNRRANAKAEPALAEAA